MKYTLAIAIFLSILAHLVVSMSIGRPRLSKEEQPKPAIKINIREVEKPAPKPPPEVVKIEPPPLPPPPPKKKEPKLAAKPKISPKKKPASPPQEPAKPVFGISPNAVSNEGKGPSVPVGNTLMMEDDGKRVPISDIKPLENEDLSADAELIVGTITAPDYTDDATHANVEGTVIIEAFVGANGLVEEVELKKKVGYGMDARIINAAKNAKFRPRKDKFGRPIAGWTEIKFRLEIR